VERAFEKYSELTDEVNKDRVVRGSRRALSEYMGTCVGFGGLFRIEVVVGEDGLAMLFQGRETQRHRLQHHHGETFTWLMSWNEQIRKGRFIEFEPTYYEVKFGSKGGEGIYVLNWVFDSAIPGGEGFVKEGE
jgi:hypothetical protein